MKNFTTLRFAHQWCDWRKSQYLSDLKFRSNVCKSFRAWWLLINFYSKIELERSLTRKTLNTPPCAAVCVLQWVAKCTGNAYFRCRAHNNSHVDECTQKRGILRSDSRHKKLSLSKFYAFLLTVNKQTNWSYYGCCRHLRKRQKRLHVASLKRFSRFHAVTFQFSLCLSHQFR